MGNAENKELIVIDGRFKHDHRVLKHKGYNDVLLSVLYTCTPLNHTLLIESYDERRCQTMNSSSVQKMKEHPFEASQFGSILWYLLGYHFAGKGPVFEEENLFAVSREDDVSIFQISHRKATTRRKDSLDSFKLFQILNDLETIQSPKIFTWQGVDVIAGD